MINKQHLLQPPTLYYNCNPQQQATPSALGKVLLKYAKLPEQLYAGKAHV
jgi:hypothetical protein